MMPGRSFDRHPGPVPAGPVPIIDLGVPCMFDIQTELHLRRTERGFGGDEASRATRAALIAANLSALFLLAVALF